MKVVRERTEILLMEYAAGSLDEASSLLVASYITICPEARRYVGACEALGGALIERDCIPVAMHSGSLRAVLARLDDTPAPAPDPCREQPRFCADQALPQPLSGHIDAHCKNARWRHFSPGTYYCPLPVRDSRHSAALIRMAPRARGVRHTHGGSELTLVLHGGYHDELGAYQAGDLVILDETVTHQPIAEDEGCLCISVTDAPLRFTRGLYRMLNIFFR